MLTVKIRLFKKWKVEKVKNDISFTNGISGKKIVKTLKNNNNL